MTWPALRSRNFRFFLGGQAFSLLGNAIQQVALGWLIYRTTHSTTLLGLAAFAGALPAAVLTPFAGVLADRTNPHGILVGTQILSIFQAILLAVLVRLGRADMAVILGLICVQGLLQGIDRPVRQMFVARLLDRREDFGSAVASSSIIYDAARMVGPTVGGWVLARHSEGPSLLLNALFQILAVALLLALRVPSWPGVSNDTSVLSTLAQGVRHSLGFRPVRAILLLSAIVSFAGSSYMVLLPVMAADAVKGGAHALGYLTSAVGAGAIAGGILFGLFPHLVRNSALISLGAGLYGVGLAAFSQSRHLGLSVLALAAAGLGIMVMMTACSTLLFSLTPGDRHGRVFSHFTLSYMIMAPLGSLTAGALANRFGAPSTLAVNAVLCLLAALWFRRSLGLWLSPEAHP